MEIAYYNTCSGTFLSTMVKVEGSKKAFDYLYDLFNPNISRNIVGFLKTTKCYDPPIHGEDIIQDMWEAVDIDLDKYYSGKKPNDYQNPFSWVLTIGRNLCAKHLKEYTKFPTSNFETANELLLQQNRIWSENIIIPSNFNDIQSKIENKEFLKLASQSFQKLTHESQDLIRMRFEGYSHAQIAKLLGITEVNARMQYSRATRMYRQIYLKAGGILK